MDEYPHVGINIPNLIGQKRGNYRLTKLLGQGGFAEVYLAEHVHLGRKVAVKVLYTRLKQDGLKQFKQEALTLTNLVHPHIIKILDFGFEADVPYLVMDFAPGGALATRHPLNTQVPLTTIVTYLKQVADALDYAHTNKIIHRDVKPENMLIGQDNTVLLGDFGIARVVETYSIGTSHITGSFQYMAPEQGAGKAVFASDQYSLGIVAYQWLSGRMPFQGSTSELMVQQRFEAPPPFPSNLRIPSSVENVVMKALSKDPQQRFATVQEFARAIEQASKGAAFYASPSSSATLTATVPATNLHMPPSVTQPQPMQSSSSINSDSLYRQGVEAYAKGDLDSAEQFWQQVLTIDPNFGNGTLAPRLAKLQQDLVPIRIKRLHDSALAHDKAAEWQQEITAWTQLLTLAPDDAQAVDRRKLAEHNQQYTWMYTMAQQFAREGKSDAAKTELKNLWQEAPYHSDPAGLARTLGIPGPKDYEQAIQEQQHQLAWQAQKAQEREREEQQRRAQQVQVQQKHEKRELKERMRKERVNDLGGNMFFIGLCLFMLVAGVGSLVGIVIGYWTQPTWMISTSVSIILALLAYPLGYRKVMTPLAALLPSLLGIAITFGVTWLTSQLNYGNSQVSHLWFIQHTLWVGRQLTFGIIIGLIMLTSLIIAFLNSSTRRRRY